MHFQLLKLGKKKYCDLKTLFSLNSRTKIYSDAFRVERSKMAIALENKF